MSWNNFTYAMGNLSNLLNFTKGVINKSSGQPLTTRLQNSGINLFGNSLALGNARDVRTYTGSNIGYMGYFSANGDANQALANTTNAGIWAANNLSPMYYDNIFASMGMYSPMYGGQYGMPGMPGMNNNGIWQNLGYYNGQNNRQIGYWA